MTIRRLLPVMLFLAACGDDAPKTPDAPGPTPDMAVDMPGATCATLAGTIAVPGMYAGTVLGGGADHNVADGVCATQTEDAWFEPKGEDVVVQLTGLTAGSTYLVTLETGADDVSFYVLDACPPVTGAITTGCSNFTDTFVTQPEVGVFVATAAEQYIVVDNPEDDPLTTGAFTLSVATAQCTPETEATACTGGTPFCVDFTCVECVGNFDCVSDADGPVCNAAGTCSPSAVACANDDLNDTTSPGDDGPGGAGTILGAGTAGKICGLAGEADYYEVTVTNSQGLDITVTWTGADDIDATIYDAQGTMLGTDFWRQPANVKVTHLAAGTYYIAVTKFQGMPTDVVTDYTITGSAPTAAQACTVAGDGSSAECATDFSTQIYRAVCTPATGVCSFKPAGAGVQGAICDSSDDCAAGGCSYITFESDANKSICTIGCAMESDCAAVTGTHCTTGFTNNFCVPACTTNLQCGAADLNSSTLDPGTPWDYMTCTVATGACSVP